jgi:hypothetical protein
LATSHTSMRTQLTPHPQANELGGRTKIKIKEGNLPVGSQRAKKLVSRSPTGTTCVTALSVTKGRVV